MKIKILKFLLFNMFFFINNSAHAIISKPILVDHVIDLNTKIFVNLEELNFMKRYFGNLSNGNLVEAILKTDKYAAYISLLNKKGHRLQVIEKSRNPHQDFETMKKLYDEQELKKINQNANMAQNLETECCVIL